MRRSILFLCVVLCFVLSGWQADRFFSKRKSAIFFEKQSQVLNSQEKFIISEDSGDLYDWLNKKYQFNIKNNKFYQAVDKLLDLSKKNETRELHDIAESQLYFKNKVCAPYIKDNAFALYNSKNSNSSYGYSVIAPLKIDNKIVLVKFNWNKSLDQVESEIKKLDSFDQKSFAIDVISSNKNLSFCFEGILLPVNLYTANKLVSFLVKNDLQKKTWGNLNSSDLEKYFNENVRNIYVLDLDLKDLNAFSKEYTHHALYCLMWFLLGLYGIFAYRKI
jgi:hypothetical protein